MRAIIVKISILLSLFKPSPGLAESLFPWLAYGDLRGHLEPCGCDPATDLGGLRRIAAVIRRERLTEPTMSVFSLGNTISANPSDTLKLPFLLEAESALKPSAVLMNKLELAALNRIAALGIHPNYVLSNFVGSLSAPNLLNQSIVSSKTIIFGYTFDENLSQHVVRIDPRRLKTWKNEIQRLDPARRLVRVLLFSGDDQDLMKIIDSGIFDTIISGNRSAMSLEPGIRERENESLLGVVPGKNIYMVPLGGQGILRGGPARFAEAKPLSHLIANAVDSTAQANINLLTKSNLVTWLDRSVGGEEQLPDLFRRYNDAAQDAFNRSAKQRAQNLSTTTFSGHVACRSCHLQANQIWEASRHARAMQTLIDKGKDKDPECVKCHVLAASQIGGFVSMDLSPQFANVQCEVCHGPRKEHAANPLKQPINSLTHIETCKQCHNSQHSPSFNFDTYWERIKHGFGH